MMELLVSNIPDMGKDVHQTLTADCWLEATLVAIVRIDPTVIKELLRDNGDGTVTVFLYDPLVGGRPTT
jgi:hypothetical protein